MRLTRRSSKWWLTALWFAGAGVVFAVLVVQSLRGVYEPRTADAWAWFLPTVMPTLSLIVGVLVADMRNTAALASADAAIDPPLFWLGSGLSALYLLLVAVTILSQPFLSAPPLELMQRSLQWIVPMQGLTVAALGAFFRRD